MKGRTNLNDLCITIRSGTDEKAITVLLSDPRIKKLMHSAVWKILEKNSQASQKELLAIAQTIIWEEIYHKYEGAEDELKGDHLVIKYVSSFLYGKLLNYVRQLKQMYWDVEERGLVKRYESTSINGQHEDVREPLYTTIEDPNTFVINDDLSLVQSIVQTLVTTKRVSQFDMLMFLKYQLLGMSYDEIVKNLKNEYGIRIRYAEVTRTVNNVLLLIINQIGKKQ